LVIAALVIALVWTCRRRGRLRNNQPVDVVNSPMGQSMTNSQAPIMSSVPSESSDLYLLEVSHLLPGSHVFSPPWSPCTCELAITTRFHSIQHSRAYRPRIGLALIFPCEGPFRQCGILVHWQHFHPNGPEVARRCTEHDCSCFPDELLAVVHEIMLSALVRSTVFSAVFYYGISSTIHHMLAQHSCPIYLVHQCSVIDDLDSSSPA
jgi:hypothetical protein